MKTTILIIATVICVAAALPNKDSKEDVPVPVSLGLQEVAKTSPKSAPKENCDSTGVVCYNNCANLINGNFQYCGNCSTFLLCQNYVTYYSACPGSLRWDDALKRCVDVSTTCEECYVAPLCSTTGPSCSSDCLGLPNGYHQICDNCTSYALCSNEAVSSILHCPDGLFFHNQEPKGCVAESETCIECFDFAVCNSTGPNCVSSCSQMDDGLYQSCENCVSFTQCDRGDGESVFCPVGMYYDDNRRGCVEASDTCMHCATPDLCESTGPDCARRCVGIDNGFYQACTNCTSYVECNNDAIIYHGCSPGMYWDAGVVACLIDSATCTECDKY